jgi:nucleoside-diphosphate-sugar epimerase
MARVLVVGGAGYIGGHTTDALLSAGHEVRVYDALLFEDRYLKPVTFVFGDIRDVERLVSHVRWADTVVWLAGLVGDPACALSPEITRAINVDSVRWLADNFDGRIIFMSSCSVYGSQSGILTEESPLNPLSLYARTKVQCEEILADSDAISFRNGTIFGVGDTYSRIRLDLVVNVLTVKACLVKRMSVFGGNQYRPLLHVKDVAQAVTANVGSGHRGIFNLHWDNMTVSDVARKILEQVPDAQVELTDIAFQDARNYRASSQKAHDTFGFSPKFTVEDGIREIKALVDEARIQDLTSTRYSNADYLRPRLLPNSTPLGTEFSASFGTAY